MRKLLAVMVIAFFSSLAWGQASVNESLETAFYWVDGVTGADTNPGTQAQPFRTIGVGVAAAEANNRIGIGSKVTVNPGIYREAVTLDSNYQDTASPITIEAAAGGPVIMSGADTFTGWQPYSGNSSIYQTVWPYQFGLCAADSGGGPFQQDIVLRREVVFVNGVPLTQVLSLTQMRQGTFFVDETNAAIYVWPASGIVIGAADVEVGTRDSLLYLNNKSDVVVRGMTFEYSNSCRNGSALPVMNSSNILLDSDTFLWNNAQGPGMIQDTDFTVQNSVANHNGIGGMAGDQSKNSLWTNNTTNYNNWRGAQGVFYNWSSAGFHPYATHSETISGLTSAYNQCFGIHWDTDNRDITVDNMVLSENLLAEVLVEKSEGPISITNSTMCGGNPITDPANEIGFWIRNSEKITLSNSTIAGASQELFDIIGTPGGYPVTDWETQVSYLLVAQEIALNNNIIVASAANQNLFYDSSLGGADWASFASTFTSDYNTWWNPLDATPFLVPVPVINTQLDFPTWQSVTQQDAHSTFAAPAGNYPAACTVPPEGPDFWYVMDPIKGLVDVSAGGTATFTTTAVAFGGFTGAVTLTVEGIQNIPGASSSWDTQTISTSGTATLTVNTSTTTPTGVYPIVMIASSGSTVRTITASVLVNTVLAVGPKVANLGSIGIGSTTQGFPVTLADLGPNGVPITSITATGDFTQTNTCGNQVGGSNKFNAQCSITLYFTPTKVGTRTGSLTIVASDPGSPINVSLTGTGTGVPAATLTPPSLTFPSLDTGLSSPPMNVTLTNTGTGDLTITDISITGLRMTDYSQAEACPTLLTVGSSCSIPVIFTPSGTGTRSASLSITDNASTFPQLVPLTGSGVAPVTKLTPASLAFGNQQVLTTSAGQLITLQNTGTGPLYISNISVAGDNPGDFMQTNACPISPNTLGVNATCTLTVTFKPTVSGLRKATISVADNTLTSPHTASLSGNGTNLSVTLTPATLSFSSQVVGVKSTAKVVTLTNKGTTNLTIASIGFAGLNSLDYGQTSTCGTTIPPSGTCTVSVTFTPTNVGLRSATLQVFDNGYLSPQVSTITGTGVQPMVILTPGILTYSLQTINTSSKTQKITLMNTGTGALTISAINIVGTNYADYSQINGCPMSPGLLGVGGSCIITVTFTPKAAGTRTASISISDNAPGTPHSTPLTGSATAVSVAPTSLTFSAITVGRTSQPRTIAVTNLGSTSLAMSGIVVAGANIGDFTQTNTCGSALAAGATCTITVLFSPTAVGLRTANVTISDSDPGSPQVVGLTGTGI